MTSKSEKIKEAVRRARTSRDRLTQKQEEELHGVLAGASVRVKEELTRFEELAPFDSGKAVRLAHLKALKSNIDRISGELSEGLTSFAPNQGEEAFKLGIRDGVGELKTLNVPNYVDIKTEQTDALVSAIFSQVDKDALDFIVKYRLELMGDVAEKLKEEIKNRIAAGITAGKSTTEIVREIGGVITDPDKFRRAGKTVFKSAQQRLTLICRTETNRAHNVGRIKFYEKAGVKRVQWWAALDARTCPVCEGCHGKRFELSALEPPPIHPRCRCSIIADMNA